MKGRKHTAEQVIRKLREGERLAAEGKNVAEVARELEISEQTYSRWRNQYGHEGGRRQGAAPAEGRERAAQAGCRRPHPGQPDAQGGCPGKLLSPSRRRDAVVHLREVFGVSERRGCRGAGQPRTTPR